MKRFIVLAHPRSGSTLLVNALQQHPAVRMHNELLTNTEDEATRRRLYTVAGRWLADGGDEAGFLRHVFEQQHGEAAVGFKLMHHHASAPGSLAWDLLRADAELCVVHLWRDDYLRTLVSEHVASRTGIWNILGEGPLPDEVEPFALEVEQCRATFEQLDHWLARARDWFGGHPLLELEYARDLEQGFQVTIERVFALLDLPAVAIQKKLLKLSRRSPREQLSNFHELRAAFADTRYARFFAD